MWVLIAIVLLTSGGSFGDDSNCLDTIENCVTFDRDDVLSINTENLLSLCQELQDIHQCYSDKLKECGRNISEIDQHIGNYLKKVCNPDSDIYKDISNDFDCVKDKMLLPCESNEELRKALKLVETQLGGGLGDMCETAIVFSVCKPAMMAEDCEEHVGEAVQEVIMNTILPSNCDKYVANMVRDVIETMHVAQFIEKVEAEFYE